VSVDADIKASPLVGEVGGGPAASAAERNLSLAPSASADDAPPPNPPHEGEGSRFRNFAGRAGTIVLGLIALDLVATLATLAFGWGMLKG
jgi:hypothetical protein